MQIKVIQVEVETIKGKGKNKDYQKLELTYKDLEKNKVASRKLVSFNYPEVFEALSKAAAGDEFNIKLVKNEESGYWDWVGLDNAGESDGGTAHGTSSGDVAGKSGAKRGGSSTYGRDFETRSERDRKQASITKAVALERALDLAKHNSNGQDIPIKVILEYAAKFEDYLRVALPDDVPLGFDDVVEGVAMMDENE